MSDAPKLGYQKAWQIQVPGLKLIDFTRDRHGIVTLDKENQLRLFDEFGKELWHRPAGYDLVSLSLADTLEVLAVDVDKHSILYGPEGTTMWRKRPFPALIAKISASGEYFSFVTSDPAIVGTDRALRVRWAYRNLMKRPADLAISGQAQVTAFPCADDRGDGIGLVNQTGKPFDPFMGMKTVVAVDVSEDGQAAIALDSGGGLYCVNPVKGFGIWKSKSSPRNTGVSLASQTGDSIVFSEQGRILRFDEKGNQVWEYSFTERLLKAFICPDSGAIYYATERGEIGCLRKNTGEVVNRMEFMEKPLPEKKSDTSFFFRKVWNVELAGSREKPPMVHCWLGHEGVEYSVVWNGCDTLLCLNDVGEEVWRERIGDSSIRAMSASADADLIAVVTDSGVIGFDIDGNESFKFLGAFKNVHVFPDCSMLLVDNNDKARFYQSPEHFSHVVDAEEKVVGLAGCGENLAIKLEKSLIILSASGEVVGKKTFASSVRLVESAEDGTMLLIGEESGELHLVDHEFNEIFNYRLAGPVGLAAFAEATNDIFASIVDQPDIVILRRRTNEILKNSLTGNPVFAVKHQRGMVIGTDLDQLGLISGDGGLLGRYTCPDHVVKLMNCRRPGCFLLVSEDSLACMGAVENTRGPDRR
jgi:outer membrane protein assembly factor BamB